MIVGVGIDMVDVARMHRKLQRGSALFLERLLSREEQAYAGRLADDRRRVEWIAGRFAAKEAVLKACGTGLDGRFMPHRIVISPDASGAPSVSLPAALLRHLGRRVNCRLSISCTRNMAMAVAYLEEEPDNEP